MDPKQVFEYGLLYHHYANTAYPLTPGSFKSFRIGDASQIPDFLNSEWSKADELSLYVHVPFCKVRCRFCEYTVLDESHQELEDRYVDLLLKEIDMYRPILQGKAVVGYDIGGGTPTKLSIANLERITNAITSSFQFNDNVEYSIETTPVIAAKEPEKIEAAYRIGYRRMSMGIQTISEKLLNELGREGCTHIYERAVQQIRAAGFQKFNIDLMYGFLHQSDEDFETTIRYAVSLKPDYITLYRNRYKGTKLEKEAQGVSLYKIINQYRLAFKLLNEHGYAANEGKNTFTRVQNDVGTSDYLTKRVIEGTPYVGMGLGAQSFGMTYLAYNEGAASKKLARYAEKVEKGLFPIQDIYSLDIQETISKAVSVAFYFGFIDLDAFESRFGVSFETHFKSEVAYVLENNLMARQDKRLYLTARGADYINGVIPLFYSDRSKHELSELYKRTRISSDGEIEFLKAYNITEYEQPSLATDIVVFAVANHPIDAPFDVTSLSVVLIRRGEHPFMNSWALPGGFVHPTESAEQTAYRELEEEAGVTGVPLNQLQMFSEPKRDPRGWIVSCAFVAVADISDIHLQFGDDAIDAKLFKVDLTEIQSRLPLDNTPNRQTYKLSLKCDETTLSARLEKETIQTKYTTQTTYTLLESNGIAFDHAKILLMALDAVST